MDIEITFTQFNALTKCLDGEVRERLELMLTLRPGIHVVEPQYLPPQTIFAVQNDEHRIELLSAFMPIRRKVEDRYLIETMVAKFLCIRHNINPRKHGWWQVDHTYGECGFTTFCIDSLDVESVGAFTCNLATHMFESLNSALAYGSNKRQQIA